MRSPANSLKQGGDGESGVSVRRPERGWRWIGDEVGEWDRAQGQDRVSRIAVAHMQVLLIDAGVDAARESGRDFLGVGRIARPFLIELAAELRCGNIRPETPIQHEGETQWLLFRERPEFAVAERATGPEPAAAGHESGAPRGGPLLRVPRNWAPPVDGAPFPAAPLSAPPASREEWPVFDWAGETARRVGTLVHAELQAMNPTGSGAAGLRAREPRYRRWLALHGVPSERLPEAASRVVEALIAVDQDPRGRWILQKAREEMREHALSGSLQGEVVRAVFDRSFVDDQGVRWVIDYKTSRHVGGGLEEFLDREVERYCPQLQRYAQLAKRLGPEPVRLGLYFPLMRAWREWAA